MKRLAVLLPILLLAGCNWPQGWHWPRFGTDTVQTWVYVQDEVRGNPEAYVKWVVGVWTQHPELAVRFVSKCPAGSNCIVARTVDLPYPVVGATGISIGSNKHLLNSLMRLDPTINQNGVYHEFCHALGGGFDTATQKVHELCNRKYHSVNWDDVTRVYHDDPG